MKGYKVGKYEDHRKVFILNMLVDAKLMTTKDCKIYRLNNVDSLQSFIEGFERYRKANAGIELLSWLCDFYEVAKGVKKQMKIILPF